MIHHMTGASVIIFNNFSDIKIGRFKNVCIYSYKLDRFIIYMHRCYYINKISKPTINNRTWFNNFVYLKRTALFFLFFRGMHFHWPSIVHAARTQRERIFAYQSTQIDEQIKKKNAISKFCTHAAQHPPCKRIVCAATAACVVGAPTLSRAIADNYLRPAAISHIKKKLQANK